MSSGDRAGWNLPQAPYPGLRPFEEHESSIFRGRDWQVAAVLDLLRRHGFVVVTGASGCGKSSLVRAGVLAELYRGSMEVAGDVWVEVYFRPGKDPLGNLVTALASKLVVPPADRGGVEEREQADRDEVVAILDRPNGLSVFRERYEDRLSLGPELDAALAPPAEREAAGGEAAVAAAGEARRLRRDANLLILADQFEEIFNEFNQGSVAAELLVARLLEAFRTEGVESPRPAAARVHVLVTMRSEYLGLCATYRGMPVALNNAAFYVSRLDRAELRAAAVEPLQRWQRLAGRTAASRLVLDEGLLARLLDAVILTKDDPDHLPLFQHALARLWWLAQDGGVLDGDLARCIGRPHLARALPEEEVDGVPGNRLLALVLEAHAEEVYGALDAGSQRVAEVMLRRLSTKEQSGNVVRRLAPVRDIAACAGCPDAAVESLVERFGAPRHELVQMRKAAGAGNDLVDLAHEALIRKWSRLSNWVNAENDLARSFEELTKDARRWVDGGGGIRNILRDDDLVAARTWLRSAELYQRTPDAIAAWAERYIGASAAGWAKRFGGPFRAVAELYRQSEAETEREAEERLSRERAKARAEAEIEQARAVAEAAEAEKQRAMAVAEAAEARARQAAAERNAQRWRLRLYVGSCGIAATALLVGGGLWYFVGMAEQRRLTEIADLYASALANSNLELGRQPPARRAAVQQELAVILQRIEQLREAGSSPEAEERLRTLERSVDSAARQVLEATVVPTAGAGLSSREKQRDERVKRCIFRADPGKQRETRQVALLAQPAEASPPGKRAYAVLSRLNNVPTLEVVYYRELPKGRCSLDMDGVALRVPTVDDLTMDAAGRWLIERPRGPADTAAVGPRLHRLNWFEVCDRVGKDGSCEPGDRRWRVDPVQLGQYQGWQEADLPSLPDGMPAPKPVASAGAGDFADTMRPPPEGFEVRQQALESALPGEGEGDELYWRGVRLSSRAQPGWNIAAYARRGDLVAFAVSARAADARRVKAEHTVAVCGGGELCQHVLRVVRVPRGDEPDPATAAIPIAEVQFVGPPVDGVGFGSGARERELVLRFAETGGFATVSLGGAEFREWLCGSQTPDAVPEPLFFSQPFRNYVKTRHGGYDRIGEVVDAACG
jgi:hypothetical protein